MDEGVDPSGGFTPCNDAIRKPAVVQLGPIAGTPEAQAGAVPASAMIRSIPAVKLVICEASSDPGAAEFFVTQRTGFVAFG